ncbi:hypothetical protein KW791_02765 [Candidatus Parcubacteria bacterium]|nr:hypothetical protein [Candidatus Parcubacteria bacterium]
MFVFEYIDAWVLSYFTKFSHWFQRMTGRTNFFLAKVFIFAYVISILVGALNYWFQMLNHPTPRFGPVIKFAIVLFWMWYISRDKNLQDEHLQGKQTKNPNELFFFLRVPLLIANLIDLQLQAPIFFGGKNVSLIDLFCYLEPLYFILFMYFDSVTPLPPGKSKVREWIEAYQAGFKKLQPIKSPNR